MGIEDSWLQNDSNIHEQVRLILAGSDGSIASELATSTNFASIAV
jgi:hypothetical protein